MKKMFLKCISCIMVTLILVYMVPLIGVQAQASVSYDRNAAVNYAAKHWNDGKGQCAEFVSACLTAGGLSVSQKVCLNLWNTLKKYGTPYKLTATSSGNGNIKLSSNKGKVEAGDPLFYVCETCGGTSGKSAFPHVVICGGTDSSGYLTAYGHNAAWNNKKVWTQFSTGAHSTHKTNIYSIHIESGNTATYTLTYNANGGSGAPSPQKYSSDMVTLSSTTPYRTGYSFQGWITTPEPQVCNCVYSPGSTQWSMGNETLYAYWKANKYTIKYNSNGGSGSMESTSHEYDAKKALSKNSFTRSGYSFVGWSQSSNATSATYTDGQSVKNLTATNGATINLYAVWKKNPTYTLTYNANGGSNPPSSQSGSTSYTVSSTKPVRSGYTFLGWSTSNSATSASYTAGDKINLSSNTTLYAVWSKITYTLTYNANGGSNPPPSQNGSTSYTVSSTKPTKNGYTFLGWSTSSSATSASYTAGDKINLSSNTTLYAVWSKITYTLTYNANGGSNPPSSQSGSTSYTVSSTMPTKNGYTFLGWSTSSSATSASYTAGDKINLSSNTTLYAVWEKNVTVNQTEKQVSDKRVETTELHDISEYEAPNEEIVTDEKGIILLEETECFTESYETEINVESKTNVDTELIGTIEEKQKSPASDNDNSVKITGMICVTALIAMIAGFIIFKKKKD